VHIIKIVWVAAAPTSGDIQPDLLKRGTNGLFKLPQVAFFLGIQMNFSSAQLSGDTTEARVMILYVRIGGGSALTGLSKRAFACSICYRATVRLNPTSFVLTRKGVPVKVAGDLPT
jgi:hypothetical protein